VQKKNGNTSRLNTIFGKFFKSFFPEDKATRDLTKLSGRVFFCWMFGIKNCIFDVKREGLCEQMSRGLKTIGNAKNIFLHPNVLVVLQKNSSAAEHDVKNDDNRRFCNDLIKGLVNL
jgi:hypothetical protein